MPSQKLQLFNVILFDVKGFLDVVLADCFDVTGVPDVRTGRHEWGSGQGRRHLWLCRGSGGGKTTRATTTRATTTSTATSYQPTNSKHTFLVGVVVYSLHLYKS